MFKISHPQRWRYTAQTERLRCKEGDLACKKGPTNRPALHDLKGAVRHWDLG